MLDFGLYVISDEGVSKRSHVQVVKELVDGGVRFIQLRDKHRSDRELLRTAIEVARICHRSGAKLIVNDRVDIAVLSGADGVHLGQEDLPIEYVKRIVPGDFIIGVTVHSVREALVAAASGATYLGAGSVFPTKTKENIKLIGLDGLREIASAVNIPVVAIGGISLDNVEDVIRMGASGVAVVSAIISKDDIRSAALLFTEKLHLFTR